MASLKNAVETALKTWLLANIDPAPNGYIGFDSAEKTAPAIICRVVSMEEDPPYSGNYRAGCEVQAKDTVGSEDDQSTLDAAVEALLYGGLAAGLVANLTGYEVPLAPASAIKASYDGEGTTWISTHSFEVIIRPVLTGA